MTTSGSDARPDAEAAPPGAMRRYVLALVAGGVIVLMLMGAMLAILSTQGTLPPPQFSNSLCLDEKLRFMHETPPRTPDLLVVGSSVAWRHFNSPAAVATQPGLRPYNAGLCGANIAQTEAVVDWLEGRLPSVERVLLIASPLDFEDCAGDRRSRFDVEAADRFVFAGTGPLRYYLRYFDPTTFVRNARTVGQRRSDPGSFDALVINAFGDGPIEPPRDRNLLYGEVALDPACFKALRGIALGLTKRGAALDVVMTPLNPEWRRRFDAKGQTTKAIDEGIAEALAGTGADLVQVDPQLDENAFFDAIHIRWSQTAEFTRSLL